MQSTFLMTAASDKCCHIVTKLLLQLLSEDSFARRE